MGLHHISASVSKCLEELIEHIQQIELKPSERKDPPVSLISELIDGCTLIRHISHDAPPYSHWDNIFRVITPQGAFYILASGLPKEPLSINYIYYIAIALNEYDQKEYLNTIGQQLKDELDECKFFHSWKDVCAYYDDPSFPNILLANNFKTARTKQSDDEENKLPLIPGLKRTVTCAPIAE